MKKEMLDRYVKQPAELADLVRGLSAEQLNATPVAGKWSLHTLVVHLVHAEIFLSARMLQVAAEKNPLFMNWEENDFLANLDYASVSVDDALATISGLRKTTAAAIGKSDESRAGIHSQVGKLTLGELLDKSVNHFAHHLTFAREKRAKLK